MAETYPIAIKVNDRVNRETIAEIARQYNMTIGEVIPAIIEQQCGDLITAFINYSRSVPASERVERAS